MVLNHAWLMLVVFFFMVLQSCLSDLLAVSNRFKEAVEFGFSQLHSSAVKPRIKPIVDTFLSTNHNITEVRKY